MAVTVRVNMYNNQVLEQIAQNILNSFGINGPSVDISTIAKKLGLNVYSSSFTDESISGFIKYENSDKNIYVSNSQPIVRQRFTIAHELAHYILHRDLLDKEGGSPLYRGGAYNQVEAQADRLAAALLMPENLVKHFHNEYKNDIAFMARIFNVSESAMYNRYRDLGLIFG